MTWNFILRFDTGNDSFAEDMAGEVSRILRKVADDVERGVDARKHLSVMDSNGNRVGSWILNTESE